MSSPMQSGVPPGSTVVNRSARGPSGGALTSSSSPPASAFDDHTDVAMHERVPMSPPLATMEAAIAMPNAPPGSGAMPSRSYPHILPSEVHHEESEHTSLVGVCAHVFKSFVGSGIFLIPTYMKDGGYIMGPIITLLMAIINIDCILIHVYVRRVIARDNVSTYSDITGFVLGPHLRSAVSGSITVLCITFVITYVQIVAGIIAEIVSWKPMYLLCVLMMGAVVLPSAIASNQLHRLGWVSLLSTACVGTLIVVTFVYILNHLIQNGTSPTAQPAGSVTSSIMFMSSMMSAYMGIPPILPIFNSMSPDNREVKFKKLFNGTLLLITVLYVLYGTVGYMTYGTDLTVSVISMLPKDWFGNLMRFLLALNLMTSVPINLIPAVQELDDELHIPRTINVLKHRKALTLRVMLTVFICGAGLFLGSDTVTLIVDFLGATICVFLSSLIPALMELHVDHAIANPTANRESWSYFKLLFTSPGMNLMKIRCWFYVAFSAFVMIVGLVLCIQRTLTHLDAQSLPSDVKPLHQATST